MQGIDFFELQYKEFGSEAQRKYPNEPMLRFLASLPKGIRILEIGCGTGANLWAIAKEGFSAVGIDAAETSMSLCKKTIDSYHTSAQIDLGDFHNLPYTNKSFDAIVDVVSMQHSDTKEKVISEIYRVLKPLGKFFSYHMAKGSTVFSDDPLTFISEDDVPELFKGFKTTIERYTRNYSDGNIVNYLAITAQKSVL